MGKRNNSFLGTYKNNDLSKEIKLKTKVKYDLSIRFYNLSFGLFIFLKQIAAISNVGEQYSDVDLRLSKSALSCFFKVQC